MYVGLTYLAISLVTVVRIEALPLDEDMLLYWRRSESEASKCKPFTNYQVGCNKCVCSADGIEFCTRMACFKSRKSKSDATVKKTTARRIINQQAIEDSDDQNL